MVVLALPHRNTQVLCLKSVTQRVSHNCSLMHRFWLEHLLVPVRTFFFSSGILTNHYLIGPTCCSHIHVLPFPIFRPWASNYGSAVPSLIQRQLERSKLAKFGKPTGLTKRHHFIFCYRTFLDPKCQRNMAIMTVSF